MPSYVQQVISAHSSAATITEEDISEARNGTEVGEADSAVIVAQHSGLMLGLLNERNPSLAADAAISRG